MNMDWAHRPMVEDGILQKCTRSLWGSMQHFLYLAGLEITGMFCAGDKIVELVAWLEKGEISAEEDLLEALAAAPLPRKGASAASKSASAAGAHASCLNDSFSGIVSH